MEDFDNITGNKIGTYSEAHTTPVSALLQSLIRETHLKTVNARMLTGMLQGRLLEMICQMLKPQNILEIGTFTGYSTISMAQYLPENGKLITIEANPEMVLFAQKFVDKTSFGNKINIINGDALKIIPSIDKTFDLIYLDADKVNYPKYYEMLFTKLNIDGWLLADNVLWSGQVVDEKYFNNKEVAALMEFNDLVQNDSRVENLLLPLRDGLMILKRII